MATAIDYTKMGQPGSGLEGSQPATQTVQAPAVTDTTSAYQYSSLTGTNSQGSDGLLDAPVSYGRADEARPSNDWQNVNLADTNFQYTGATVESGGLLDNAVGDINRLTADNNPLMQQAATRGMQAGAERGLANSSMSATAGQQAALDTVMPLVNTRMNTDAQGLLNNQQGGITSNLNEQQTQNTARLNNSQGAVNAQLQDLNVENQAYLTAVDQSYNAFMEGNKNAMSFYQTSQEQIGMIMNNNDMTLEQRQEAIYEIQTALSAGLNFNGSLYSADFGGGAQPASGGTPVTGGAAPTTPAPAGTSPYPGGTNAGGYPGQVGGQTTQSDPKTLFGAGYLSTAANGSLMVDGSKLEAGTQDRIQAAKLLQAGAIKWDGKQYVLTDKAQQYGVLINNDLNQSKAGQPFKGDIQLGWRAANAVKTFADIQGLTSMDSGFMKYMQELASNKFTASINLRSAANAEND